MRSDIPSEVLTASHRVHTTLVSVRGGDVLADDVPLFSGFLDVDAANNVPALLDLRFSPEWMPDDPLHPLAPFGQRLQVRQTLTVGPAEHTIDLGEYLITESRMDEGQVSVRAQGLEYLILDARLTRRFRPRSTFVETLEALCQGIIETDTSAMTDRAWPSSVSEDWADDNERMTLLRDIERAWPATFSVDTDGVLVAVPERGAVADTPDVHWRHGQADAYVSLSSASTREDIYNAYVQRSENDDGRPVQATATDESPASPTYYLGPFGQRPRFSFVPGLTKNQCRSAARAGLARELRRARRIAVDAPPDPRVEVYDTAAVTTADGTRYKGIITETGLPLTASDGAARYIIGEVQPWP